MGNVKNEASLLFLVLFSKRVFLTDETRRARGSAYFSGLSLQGRLAPPWDLFCGSSPLESSVYSTDSLNGLISPHTGKEAAVDLCGRDASLPLAVVSPLLWGWVPGPPTDTRLQGCSSPLSKMAQNSHPPSMGDAFQDSRVDV